MTKIFNQRIDFYPLDNSKITAKYNRNITEVCSFLVFSKQ